MATVHFGFLVEAEEIAAGVAEVSDQLGGMVPSGLTIWPPNSGRRAMVSRRSWFPRDVGQRNTAAGKISEIGRLTKF
jgi:hypothetical protein